MDTETRYNAALDYLYSFVDYSLKHSSELAKAEFNLDRMFALLQKLGNPHQQYPVIHVAGTKGKGSTCALVASALQAAGYRTGLYTSPHLLDFCERIQVNGENIAHAQFADLVDEIKDAVASVPFLTTFEITTALGFLHFARTRAGVAVIEVGLGGRLDATNVVTPAVSVITSLSYDHMAVLGNTLALIAGEKAGIIKEGVPIVSAPQQPEALAVLEKIAAQRNAPLTLVGRDVLFTPRSHNLDGQNFTLTFPAWGLPPVELHIPLLGAHQVENAATAYAALQVSGLGLAPESISTGFSAARWQCRFEVVSREPFIVLDSAHNGDSFEKLSATLAEYLPGRKVTLVLGVSEDKHLAEMLRAIRPQLARLIVTRADHPRALQPEQIIETAKQVGVESIEALTPVDAAFARALAHARVDDSVIVSAGSMFVTGEVKAAWQKVG
jgi:dihydrofolate synthase / folylpolyglutamate synthase